LAIADLVGIENDLDGLSVSAVIAIRRVRCAPAGVANSGGDDAIVAAKQILHAPETSAGQYCAFFAHDLLHAMQLLTTVLSQTVKLRRSSIGKDRPDDKHGDSAAHDGARTDFGDRRAPRYRAARHSRT